MQWPVIAQSRSDIQQPSLKRARVIFLRLEQGVWNYWLSYLLPATAEGQSDTRMSFKTTAMDQQFKRHKLFAFEPKCYS